MNTVHIFNIAAQEKQRSTILIFSKTYFVSFKITTP